MVASSRSPGLRAFINSSSGLVVHKRPSAPLNTFTSPRSRLIRSTAGCKSPGTVLINIAESLPPSTFLHLRQLIRLECSSGHSEPNSLGFLLSSKAVARFRRRGIAQRIIVALFDYSLLLDKGLQSILLFSTMLHDVARP